MHRRIREIVLSIERAYRDILIFGLIIIVPFILFGALYRYLITQDVRLLYLGIILVFIELFAALAKYRFFVDYILTLVRRWK